MPFDILGYRDQHKDYYGDAPLEEVAKDAFKLGGYDQNFPSHKEWMKDAGFEQHILADNERRNPKPPPTLWEKLVGATDSVKPKLEDPEEVGVVHGIARGTVRGLRKGVGAVGEAIQALSPDSEVGKKIAEFGTEGDVSPEKKGFWEKAAEPFGMMLPVMAAHVIAPSVALPADIAYGGIFGLQQMHETEKLMKEKGLEPGIAPLLTGGATGLAMFAAPAVLGKFLSKPISELVGKEGALKSIEGIVKPSAGTLVKDFIGKTFPMTEAVFLAQTGAVAGIEQAYGLPHDIPAELWETAKTAAGMSLLQGAVGVPVRKMMDNAHLVSLSSPAGESMDPVRRKKFDATRRDYAEGVARILEHGDRKDLALGWKEYTDDKIANNEAIDIKTPIDKVSSQGLENLIKRDRLARFVIDGLDPKSETPILPEKALDMIKMGLDARILRDDHIDNFKESYPQLRDGLNDVIAARAADKVNKIVQPKIEEVIPIIDQKEKITYYPEDLDPQEQKRMEGHFAGIKVLEDQGHPDLTPKPRMGLKGGEIYPEPKGEQYDIRRKEGTGVIYGEGPYDAKYKDMRISKEPKNVVEEKGVEKNEFGLKEVISKPDKNLDVINLFDGDKNIGGISKFKNPISGEERIGEIYLEPEYRNKGIAQYLYNKFPGVDLGKAATDAAIKSREKVSEQYSVKEKDYQKEADRLGIKFDGIWKLSDKELYPHFTDSETNGSFIPRAGETVEQALGKLRNKFGVLSDKEMKNLIEKPGKVLEFKGDESKKYTMDPAGVLSDKEMKSIGENFTSKKEMDPNHPDYNLDGDALTKKYGSDVANWPNVPANPYHNVDIKGLRESIKESSKKIEDLKFKSKDDLIIEREKVKHALDIFRTPSQFSDDIISPHITRELSRLRELDKLLGPDKGQGPKTISSKLNSIPGLETYPKRSVTENSVYPKSKSEAVDEINKLSNELSILRPKQSELNDSMWKRRLRQGLKALETDKFKSEKELWETITHRIGDIFNREKSLRERFTDLPEVSEEIKKPQYKVTEEAFRKSTLGGFPNLKLKDVQDVFKGQEVTQTKSGIFAIKMPNNNHLLVKSVDSITPGEVEMKMGYGKDAIKDNEVVAGAYADGVIRLTKGYGDKWTLHHESVHYIEDFGVLNENELNLLQRHIVNLVEKGQFKSANLKDIGGTEDRANFLADALTKPPQGLLGRILTKIHDFVDRLVNAFDIRTVAGITRDIKSGEIYERFNIDEAVPATSPLYSLRERLKPFFSKLDQVVGQKMGGKMPMDQLTKMLKSNGVTDAEIQNLIGDVVPHDGKVTKQQVVDAVKANTTEFKDHLLGEKTGAEGKNLTTDIELDEHNEWKVTVKYSDNRVIQTEFFGSENAAENWANDRINVDMKKQGNTRYSAYQEPGAKEGTYRELFVTTPTKEGPMEGQGNWRDGHSLYDEVRNPIIRVRYNERDINGKRILFVEEMQGPSDIEQQKMPEYLQKRIYDIGVKRVLALAKEGGYDVIAWTSGEMQADRYDLSSQVESIKWEISPEGYKVITIEPKTHEDFQIYMDKDDIIQTYQPNDLAGHKLEEVVGKELAKEILKDEQGHLAGLDLKVGGEGLKTLYDKQIPSLFKKYGKEKVDNLDFGISKRKLLVTDSDFGSMMVQHVIDSAKGELGKWDIEALLDLQKAYKNDEVVDINSIPDLAIPLLEKYAPGQFFEDVKGQYKNKIAWDQDPDDSTMYDNTYDGISNAIEKADNPKDKSGLAQILHSFSNGDLNLSPDNFEIAKRLIPELLEGYNKPLEWIGDSDEAATTTPNGDVYSIANGYGKGFAAFRGDDFNDPRFKDLGTYATGEEAKQAIQDFIYKKGESKPVQMVPITDKTPSSYPQYTVKDKQPKIVELAKKYFKVEKGISGDAEKPYFSSAERISGVLLPDGSLLKMKSDHNELLDFAKKNPELFPSVKEPKNWRDNANTSDIVKSMNGIRTYYDTRRMETGIEIPDGITPTDAQYMAIANQFKNNVSVYFDIMDKNGISLPHTQGLIANSVRQIRSAINEVNSPNYKRPQYSIRDLGDFESVKAMMPGNELLKGVKKGVQSLLLPTAKSKEHLEAAEITGRNLGDMNRENAVFSNALRADEKLFTKMGIYDPSIPLEQNEGMKFASDVSVGRPFTDNMKVGRPLAKDMQVIADHIQNISERLIQRLDDAGVPLQTVREHYFPGMWTKNSIRAFNQAVIEAVDQKIGEKDSNLNEWNKDQKDWIRKRTDELLKLNQGSDQSALSYLTRRPFKGKEGFRKEKVFDDIMTAVEFGLKPISTNPIELMKLKFSEMSRSIMANKSIQEFEAKGDIINVNNSGIPLRKELQRNFNPSEWDYIDDKYGTIWINNETSSLPEKVGYRLARKPVADILNNYLSSSIYNSPYFGEAFKSYMLTAHVLNQTQLGVLSAFHAGFTSIDVSLSQVSMAVKDLYGVIKGNRTMSDLLKSVGKIPGSFIQNPMAGTKILHEWETSTMEIPIDVPINKLPQSNEGRVAMIAKATAIAGGGFRMERGLRSEWTDKMMQEWYGGNKLKAAMRSPVAFTELCAKPILDWLVPRQKAGVFGELAGRLMEMNPEKTLKDLAPELRQAWNRVDARLGQVQYDRLFINNAAKNAVQALIRAPGWTGGTIAEVGGSLKDASKFLKEWVKTGTMPKDIPDRVAYTISLMSGMAVINGLFTYLFTGEKPHDQDFWAFRDGSLDEYGRASRWVLPSYQKDIYSYSQDPTRVLLAKTHPMISLIGDMMKNKDFYGVRITSPEDTLLEKTGERALYAAKQFIPFWMRGASKEIDRGGGFEKVAKETPQKLMAPQIGVMPAPATFTETPFEKYAYGLKDTTMKTKKEFEHSQLIHQLTASLRRGDSNIKEDIVKARQEHKIDHKDMMRIMKESRQSPIVNLAHGMHIEDLATGIREHATEEEKKILTPLLMRKYRSNVQTMDLKERDKYLNLLDELKLKV